MIVDETLVYEGWTRLRRMTVRMPDGALLERHVEDHGAAAAVLAYDPARRCALLVSMPRLPVFMMGQEDLLEAIAGALDGQDPEDCVRREAMEEAGVRLQALEWITTVWPMPTLSLETVACYLAPYSVDDRVADGGGAAGEHENIKVHEVPLRDLVARCRTGALRDMKTLVLVQALQLRHAHLFD